MPIDPSLSPARLADLLIEPREHLHIEIKEWLDLQDRSHRALLAKEIIALANHGGGFIIVGFREENDGTFSPASPQPTNLDAYSQDVINEIVRTYIDPALHCSVHHETHTATGLRFPIIVVPGGHRQPVMAKRGSPDNNSLLSRTVYCRRAGPVSEQPQSADEWRDLMDRCLRNGREDLLDAFRTLMAGGPSPVVPSPSESEVLSRWIDEGRSRFQGTVASKLTDPSHPARFPLGYNEFAYIVLGDIKTPDMQTLRSYLEGSVVRHTGWPCWWVPTSDGIRPYVADGAIECALGLNPSPTVDFTPDHSDFWRASPAGRLFLIRGYTEDSHPDKLEPGQGFDITTPTWRLGDALLHSANFARLIAGENSEVLFRASWTGLNGRQLVSIGNASRILFDGHFCRQEQYTTLDVRLRTSEISDALPEIVDGMLRPLYELFDFFQLPTSLTAEELAQMRRNRF